MQENHPTQYQHRGVAPQQGHWQEQPHQNQHSYQEQGYHQSGGAYGHQQQQYAADQPNPANTGNNQLAAVATPLLTLITQIRHTADHPNVPMLKAQIIEEINQFERNLQQLGYSARTIAASRYAICTAMDEAVLAHPWGTNSVWVQESLLTHFHNETWGGERFYIILEDMLRDIRGNIDFIEFIYFLLSLGYEGKFYGEENRAGREEIRNRLFYRIRQTRMKPEKTLSPAWKAPEENSNQIDRKRRLKKLSLLTLIVLLIMGGIYNWRLYDKAEPTLKALNEIGKVSPVTTFWNVTKNANTSTHKNTNTSDTSTNTHSIF